MLLVISPKTSSIKVYVKIPVPPLASTEILPLSCPLQEIGVEDSLSITIAEGSNMVKSAEETKQPLASVTVTTYV